MPFRESLACGLQKCVGNLWKGNDYSDFNVIVEDTSFKCHRFILGACSVFFRGMFQSPMKEQIEGRAKLEGMTTGTFEIIINAVYTGIEEISIDNVLDVWSATEMLQIGYLTDQCHKFVKENISVDTCFRFLNHATLYDAQAVIDHCLDFISRNFQKFVNENKLLQLSFDQFYKVIANDYLATDSEELVVEAILNWIKYVPRSAQSRSLDSGSNGDGIHDINCEQRSDDSSRNRLTNIFNQENINDDQSNVSSDVITECRNICSQIIETRENVNKHAVVPVQCINVSPDINTDENRKQHLAQLLSACRLFTVKSDFLGKVMMNNAHLLVDTGAYQFMHEALMYTVDICRRHDAWPDAAVYRDSSEFKHVMVFLSNDKIMAYILNTDCVADLVELPENCQSSNSTISVFDNILYLLSNSFETKQFYMLEKGKTWIKMNTIDEKESIVLLPHGNSVYYCCMSGSNNNDRSLNYFKYANEWVSEWTECGQLEDCGNCLVRFHKYVLVFCTKGDDTTVECYNTETGEFQKCTTLMRGTSEDMVSFTHREDVYILQRNGTLWKVFSTDTTPVDFELVCQLWDIDCSLKGSVIYRQTLYVFCNSKEPEPALKILAGLYISIRIINIDTTKSFLPMSLKGSCIKKLPPFLQRFYRNSPLFHT